MKHVVSFSGGVGSWATGRRVAQKYGTDDLVLLVADTNTEADDWRPFVDACHADIGGELIMLDNDGKDIWDTFKDARFIGNSRVDVCSRVLKREPLRAWFEETCDPENTIVYLGFDWTEEHRLHRARPYWEPWHIESPLCDPPYLQKAELLEELDSVGIPRPKLYAAGFPHNNCGGACVKGGQAQWRRLLFTDPRRYAYHEDKEEEMREFLDKNISILRDRTGGESTPLTLRSFRERITKEPSLFDKDDGDACSCMTPMEPREIHVQLGSP